MAPKKSNKEVTVKEADEKAQDAKTIEHCMKGIYDEAMKLHKNETHSIQQMMAYYRQLEKIESKKK